MDDKDLEILRLKGEIEIIKAEFENKIAWWAGEQDFWRRKYLSEHPENDNWDYVESAKEMEEEQ